MRDKNIILRTLYDITIYFSHIFRKVNYAINEEKQRFPALVIAKLCHINYISSQNRNYRYNISLGIFKLNVKY